MRNRIKFIIIMVMAIVCTMTANAQKDVYFATHRFVQDEYGEILPNRRLNEAYCPTRIEVNKNTKTLLIKTKTRGTVSYKYKCINWEETDIDERLCFYNAKLELIGCLVFDGSGFNDSSFKGLFICRKNDTMVMYVNPRKFDIH